jgi:uncharacterized protein YeaO (DUF488 family)
MNSSVPRVRVRRVYEAPLPDDGLRVLVDRLWPRGLTKERAALDEWCKAVAPSAALRTWYGHDPARFEEFSCRYSAELRTPDRVQALTHLQLLATTSPLTLLTATKQPDLSEATTLLRLLRSP